MEPENNAHLQQPNTVYMLCDEYEQWQSLQYVVTWFPFALIYVSNPDSLLTLNPAPAYVLNVCDLSKLDVIDDQASTTGRLLSHTSSVKRVLEQLVQRGTHVDTHPRRLLRLVMQRANVEESDV